MGCVSLGQSADKRVACRCFRCSIHLSYRPVLPAGQDSNLRPPAPEAITGLLRPAPFPRGSACSVPRISRWLRWTSITAINRGLRPATHAALRETTRIRGWEPGCAGLSPRTGVEPVVTDNRFPSTRVAALAASSSVGTAVGWPGRTRTGDLPLRRRSLCPTKLRAIGGLGRIRTGVTSFAGWYLTARSRDLGALGPTRTGDLAVRNRTRYPLRYESLNALYFSSRTIWNRSPTISTGMR
jgi:hypothetical protein